jgi:DNA-binding response OmpR family regulator
MSQDRKEPCIFVVDDEPILAKTLAMIFRSHGFQAHSFNLPIEALRTSRELPPDLLIADVVMPRLSGIDLAIQIREHCPNCKVILFSGQAETADFLAIAEASGHDFELLTKPVHPADLLKRLHAEFDA